MATIFITGLSGVGKSSVLEQLSNQGYHVVDTDYGYTKEIRNGDSEETVWDEDKVMNVIDKHKHSHLLISGCYSNQGDFYKYFDRIILLKAELGTMLDRIRDRTNSHYGKSESDQAEIIESYENVLPLLEKSSDVIIDTTNLSIEDVCNLLVDYKRQSL